MYGKTISQEDIPTQKISNNIDDGMCARFVVDLLKYDHMLRLITIGISGNFYLCDYAFTVQGYKRT